MKAHFPDRVSFPKSLPIMRLFPLLLVILVPGALAAQQSETGSRLLDLGRLWGHVKYHHPYLAYGTGIDWDSALVTTIPQVIAARSPAEFRLAIGRMLEQLHDPLTRVVAPSVSPAGRYTGGLGFHSTPDSIVVVSIHEYYALGDSSSAAALASLQGVLPSARAVVFDLRTGQEIEQFGRYQLLSTLEALQRIIGSHSLNLPGTRRLVYYGYPGVTAFSSGQYRSGFFTRFPERSRAAVPARTVALVYILNQNSPVPPSVLAHQSEGKALIVVDGTHPGAGNTRRLELHDSVTVDVRIEEPIHVDGTSAELIPDVVLTGSEAQGYQAAVDSAVGLARTFTPSSRRGGKLSAVAQFPPERAYSAMEYPSVEYRLLALFRFWSTIELFYPYKHLLKQSWDSILVDFLPRFREAADPIAYQRAVAEMATRLHDSHAYVSGSFYNRDVIGEGYAPLRARVIEGVPVVVGFTSMEARRSGLEPGDVILRVDGEDALTRLERYRGLLSASTPQSSRDKAALSFMNGSVGSRVHLRVRTRLGSEREFALFRQKEDFTTLYHRERSGEIIQVLPGNIGYADLDRLTLDMVDSMFQQLKDTRALIFDMRGYPHGTFWMIAPRLSSGQQRAALLETPMVGHDSPAPAVEAFYQSIGPTPPGHIVYSGRTVMLMDERSQSQAEHTGLFLRAANQTTFVGSPTAGANGELTTLTLPGGMTVGFTGQSVRHPDGSQLQRVGLVPDVLVSPTIRGIREGRDEVLEAAIKLFSSN